MRHKGRRDDATTTERNGTERTKEHTAAGCGFTYITLNKDPFSSPNIYIEFLACSMFEYACVRVRVYYAQPRAATEARAILEN